MTDGTTYQVTTRQPATISPPAAPTPAASTAIPTRAAPTALATAAPHPSGANPCRQAVAATRAPASALRIVAVDKRAEVVTIQNTGATALDLTGWTICSVRGHQRHAQLTSMLAAGATQAVPSQAGRAIWNNRAAESAAVYTQKGDLMTYWSEAP